jgi:hypothetical protein
MLGQFSLEVNRKIEPAAVVVKTGRNAGVLSRH